MMRSSVLLAWFDGQPVKDYLIDRFEQWAIDEGVSYDAVRAILARKDEAPVLATMYADMQTLAAFKTEPSAEALSLLKSGSTIY